MKKIIIIGAGYGGLCSAALLAKAGYHVQVLEKNSKLGGRAMTFEANNYKFDMGPSWYLMPEVFEKYFEIFGKNIKDYLKLIPLDPMYRMYFSPEEHIDIVRDLQKNLEQFEKIEKGAFVNIKKYLDEAKVQYDLAMENFLYTEFRNIFDLFKLNFLKVGKDTNVFRNLDNHISHFTKDDRLKKILGYTMVFLGGAPNNTPALYSLMSHVDYNLGVFYPEGGFSALTDAYVKLGTEYGVQYKTSTKIKEIVVENGICKGVLTSDNELIEADIVISNADYQHTDQKLLKPEFQSYSKKYWEKATLAPSAYIIHLGLNKKIPGLLHHNLILTHDWQAHFDEIFDNPKWPDKPSYYVCCPTKTDTKLAPKDHDILFVLVPVAPGLDDNELIRNQYFEKIINDLELHIKSPIKKYINYQKIYSHQDFIADYNAFKGTALGLAHTLKQTAFLRPSMKSKKISNLYFVGQYTQPGIGVPITNISAQLITKRIISENAR